MGKDPSQCRDTETVVKSPIWPFPGLTPKLDSKRQRAIFEVLSRVPDSALAHLNSKAGTFEWFIPEKYEFAGVVPFLHTRVLHLAYILEKWRSWGALVATVAHELAHIALDHGIKDVGEEERQREEKDAQQLVISWGFKREEQKYQNTRCAQETRALGEIFLEVQRHANHF